MSYHQFNAEYVVAFKLLAPKVKIKMPSFLDHKGRVSQGGPSSTDGSATAVRRCVREER